MFQEELDEPLVVPAFGGPVQERMSVGIDPEPYVFIRAQIEVDSQHQERAVRSRDT